MRLFVAIRPPAAAVRDLDAAVSVARQPPSSLRWISLDRWHLTLAFLGAVGEDVLPDLSRRLQRVAQRHDPLTLSFAGSGRFGRAILWVGVAGDADALRRLARSTSAAARRCGIQQEDRTYRPHLTLARSRDGAGLSSAVEALHGYAGPPWAAADLVLMRSNPPAPREAPIYDEILRLPLGRGADASSEARPAKSAPAEA